MLLLFSHVLVLTFGIDSTRLEMISVFQVWFVAPQSELICSLKGGGGGGGGGGEEFNHSIDLKRQRCENSHEGQDLRVP